ncbi:MAG: type II toxin-antitoxin system HicB family antitoxin [Treponema sp.]|jgi:predicted RNase H-like HicB family nuclease|nr:type II toxin-antitoxin system HicB family antitoxin [Treponema sp.]
MMQVKAYVDLPYHIVIRHITDASGSYYLATVLELDGCMSDGLTYQEAFENIKEAMEGWIETKLENGFPVPVPLDTESLSEQLVVQLPKSLHARLARQAERAGLSLNQYTLHKLSV